MSETESIEFTLKGDVEGVPITPRTIGLSQFNAFNQQVETFISGSERLKLDEAHVEIEEGSYKLKVLLPLVAAVALETDLRLLAREDSLGEIDPKRAEVVKRWQASSKGDDSLAYEIGPTGTPASPIRISSKTDFRIGEISPWVAIEKYFLGTVVDMGGAQKANVHVRLADTGRIIRIATSQDYLHEQDENRLYRKVLVHARAEQHHKTGDLRKLQMISFVDYSPVYDEDALDRFAEKGKEAWGDVPDAAAWVREMRGGE